MLPSGPNCASHGCGSHGPFHQHPASLKAPSCGSVLRDAAPGTGLNKRRRSRTAGPEAVPALSDRCVVNPMRVDTGHGRLYI